MTTVGAAAVLFAVFGGIIVALALRAAAAWLAGRIPIPAWLGVLLIVLGLLAALALLGWTLADDVAAQVRELARRVPLALERLEQSLSRQPRGELLLVPLGWTRGSGCGDTLMAVAPLALDEPVPSPPSWIWRVAAAVGGFARTKPLGMAGALIVALMLLTALLANVLAPYDPVATDYSAMFAPPGAQHWLGTDSFGRDVLSRIIFGSRTALLVGFCASLVGASAGLLIGAASGYFGGRVDLVIQRVMDVFLSFPLIILALAVVAILGSGVGKVIVAILIPMIPRAARVCRSNALAVREMPYVDAARAAGFGHLRIVVRHVLPNLAAPYLIMLTAFLGQAILLEASLSYLGLGVQEPTPAWGLMLQGAAAEYAESAPWIAVFPGLAISLAVFAFNLFGDSLRDALDPRLRSL